MVGAHSARSAESPPIRSRIGPSCESIASTRRSSPICRAQTGIVQYSVDTPRNEPGTVTREPVPSATVASTRGVATEPGATGAGAGPRLRVPSISAATIAATNTNAATIAPRVRCGLSVRRNDGLRLLIAPSVRDPVPPSNRCQPQ